MGKNVCINIRKEKGKRNVVKRNHKKKTSDYSVFHRIDVFANDVFCCHLLLNIYDDRSHDRTDIKINSHDTRLNVVLCQLNFRENPNGPIKTL